MKFIPLLFLAALLAPAPALDDRPVETAAPPPASPALPANPPDSSGKSKPAGESRTPSDAAQSLLPEVIRPVPKPSLPVARKNVSILRPPATSAELDMRIRYRRARNIAESDSRVRAAWDESRAARTDRAKKAALKRYYDRLFARILSIDRGVAPMVEERKQHGGKLHEQFHLTQTGSLE